MSNTEPTPREWSDWVAIRSIQLVDDTGRTWIFPNTRAALRVRQWVIEPEVIPDRSLLIGPRLESIEVVLTGHAHRDEHDLLVTLTDEQPDPHPRDQ